MNVQLSDLVASDGVIRICSWVTIAVVVALPSVTHAQAANNAVGITIEFAPEAELEGDLGLDSPPRIAYRNVRFNALVPIELEDWDTILVPGAAYRLYRPRINDRVLFETPDELHDLRARLNADQLRGPSTQAIEIASEFYGFHD